MKSVVRTLLCSAIVLTAAVGTAHADDVFYSDFATWAAAAPGSTTINFDSVTPADPSGATFIPVSITIGGVTFSAGPNGTDNELFIIGPDAYGFGVPAFSAQSTGNAAIPEDDALITFSTPQTAAGFDFIVSPGVVTITLSDGSIYVVPDLNSPPDTNFFGFTSANGITSIDIATPESLASLSMNITDVDYTSAPTVPEPSSILMVGTGIAGLGGMLRKKFTLRS